MVLVCVDTVKQINNNSFCFLDILWDSIILYKCNRTVARHSRASSHLKCLNLQHAGIVLISYETTAKLLFMCAMLTDSRGKPLQPSPTVATSTFIRMVQWHTWHLHKWQRPEIMLKQLSKDVMEGC